MTFLAANISAGFHQINFLKTQKCSARSPLSNDVHKKRIWWIHERPIGAKESATFGLGGRALEKRTKFTEILFFSKKMGKTCKWMAANQRQVLTCFLTVQVWHVTSQHHLKRQWQLTRVLVTRVSKPRPQQSNSQPSTPVDSQKILITFKFN